ncbi:MbtH family protein [Streptomyces cremeus]|uniref:MbtH family protein n=1 Tax=Streptomyces cremeus TaxID=66881 RepID=A0ABV5PMS3_STRCM
MFDDDREYTVVINGEEQYSIWPVGRDVPAGWYEVGTRGSKDICLEHIKEVWTDMRPKSLRDRMSAPTS